MNYFFYNTDAKCISEEPKPRFSVLIKEGFAAVGGDRQKYGEQLNQLNPDDILLMYENRVGVVAVGRVCEKWDSVQHGIPNLKYYTSAEVKNEKFGNGQSPYEYRIKVHWCDLSKSPIKKNKLMEAFNYKPNATTVTRGTIQKIRKQRSNVCKIIIEELQAKTEQHCQEVFMVVLKNCQG